jgi:ADP-dependent NAD(P)H-hydrate dehydratase / NAD(P)H-hydrate epimerase
MQIYTGTQIRDWDRYTIEHEPIRAIDLMERAAVAITTEIAERWDSSYTFVALAGPGNNGGDALAVARLLSEKGRQVEAYLFNTTGKLSDECSQNMRRLQNTKKMKKVVEVTHDFEPPRLDDHTVVIDGLFGAGLNKPLHGGFASVVKYVNSSQATVVSIDIPSGVHTEDNTGLPRQNMMRADLTLTLQQKKLSMYLADNEPYFGEIKTVDIGLSKEFVRRTHASFSLLEKSEVMSILRPRSKFAHKGTMGHALLFAGSYGMAGAAILAARAALRSGVGKVTVHTPLCNNDILQIAVPEAILQHDTDEHIFAHPADADSYDAVALGPGIGRNEDTAIALMSQIRRTQCPIVLDADALNILAEHRAWINQLPFDLVLTPHPMEFDRLAGSVSDSSYARLAKACALAEKMKSYIVLKGHYTALCCPDGETIINPTGNAGMATAGAGDVLTGVIAGLLARGYTRREACIVGMYMHGLAGDIAASCLGEESLTASDIVKFLSGAFQGDTGIVPTYDF